MSLLPDLQAALDEVIPYLEENPTLLRKWDMADLNAMIRSIQLKGPKADGWHQEDIDYLIEAVQCRQLDKEITNALTLVISNA